MGHSGDDAVHKRTPEKKMHLKFSVESDTKIDALSRFKINYQKNWLHKAHVCSNQGNLKGESVVAAILLSCMEVSYCTFGFFVAKFAK